MDVTQPGEYRRLGLADDWSGLASPDANEAARSVQVQQAQNLLVDCCEPRLPVGMELHLKILLIRTGFAVAGQPVNIREKRTDDFLGPPESSDPDPVEAQEAIQDSFLGPAEV